jgi:hypothetical protein
LIAGGIAVEAEVGIKEVDERGQASRCHRHISNLHSSSLFLSEKEGKKKIQHLNLQEDRVRRGSGSTGSSHLGGLRSG